MTQQDDLDELQRLRKREEKLRKAMDELHAARTDRDEAKADLKLCNEAVASLENHVYALANGIDPPELPFPEDDDE